MFFNYFHQHSLNYTVNPILLKCRGNIKSFCIVQSWNQRGSARGSALQQTGRTWTTFPAQSPICCGTPLPLCTRVFLLSFACDGTQAASLLIPRRQIILMALWFCEEAESSSTISRKSNSLHVCSTGMAQVLKEVDPLPKICWPVLNHPQHAAL